MAYSDTVSSDISFATNTFDLYIYIYINYVNVHASNDKLDDTIYTTWVSDVKLLIKSKEYIDHVTPKVIFIVFAFAKVTY